MRISVHPDRTRLSARVRALGRERDVPFEGELYRFINPRFYKAADTISGEGGLHACGRWNLTGEFRLSYTALCPDTALSEALAHVRYYELPLSKALPRVLVALRLKVSRVLDLRDGQVRKSLVLGENTIRSLDWRAENQQGREALTQGWGFAFAGTGFEAVIVPQCGRCRRRQRAGFHREPAGGEPFFSGERSQMDLKFIYLQFCRKSGCAEV